MSERTLPLLDGTQMHQISNSESSCWLTCQRKYYYEFDLNLQPKQANAALSKGTLLHEILGHYYQFLMEHTGSRKIAHEQATKESRSFLQTFINHDAYALDVVVAVDKMLAGYWAFYDGDPQWEILAVERKSEMPMTSSFLYPMRLDLLVYDRNYNAKVLVDHKTAYNFWTQDDIDLNAQQPKYLATLRANGEDVKMGIVNQIRTREIKNPTTDQLFKRAVIKPSNVQMKNLVREQVVAMQQIVRHKELPVEVREQMVLRNLNSKFACKYCDVKPLCISELNGGDITTLIAADFRTRTYGYDGPADVLDEL